MLLALLGLFALQDSVENPPDQVTLTSGKVVQGLLLRVDEDFIYLGDGTRTDELKAKKVDSISGPRVAFFSDYITRLEYVYSEQAGAADALALADWCKEKRLLRSVDLHLWRAVVLDPEIKDAHERLGHRLGSDGIWEHRMRGGQWLDLDKMYERRLSIRDPWNFSTTHFDVEAGGPLRDVLYACATMEAVYYRFYTLLQEHGRFYELRKPIHVRLYPSREDDYPEIAPTVSGYYERSDFIVHLFFDGPLVKNLIRVTVHAIFERSAYELVRSPPTLAGWLYEGIASYFEGCFEQSEGVPVWWKEKMRDVEFRQHSEIKKPFSVSRVMSLVESDFAGVSDATRAYSQSYTLFYYLMHGAPSEVQEAFHGYLPSAWESRGTGSHLKKALGRKPWKALDDDWTEFVEEAVRRQT
jgi:hypothetical protein